MIHFNIATKTQINPFEHVKYVMLAHGSSLSIDSPLLDFLNKEAKEVSTKKVDDKWAILYDITILNFVTLIRWFQPYRGEFQFPLKSYNKFITYKTIHFRIDGDIMCCF